MKKLFIFTTVLFLSSCWGQSDTKDSSSARWNNTINPERGFSSQVELDENNFSNFYEDGVTLVHTVIRLDSYRSSDIPQTYLDKINSFFGRARGSGVKVIVRFAYNDGPYPNPEPDAAKDKIISHIGQLSSVLKNNADVIAWFEAGFIGAWGEWHTSTNGLDHDNSAKQEIMQALMTKFPSSRSILFRYPPDIMTFFGSPLEAASAHNGTNQARMGFHNDCFLATADDEGTFGRSTWTMEQEKAYLHQTTLYVPVGGESCALNPPRSDCETAVSELEYFHYSELNDGWHPDVLSSWERQGCYDDIEARLGYRFTLNEVHTTATVAPGGILDISFVIENSGFAAPVNERTSYLVLTGSQSYQVALNMDVRTITPGSSAFHYRLRLPYAIPNGEYDVGLWLPDTADTLQGNAKYSIAISEKNWNSLTGVNSIAKIYIDSAVEGDIDTTATELSVLP